MLLPNEVIEEAVTAQQAAAFCDGAAIRLVAGPGSGKSRVIRDRVVWLAGSVPPDAICVVSFTRASAADLQADIEGAWQDAGLETPCPVRVSTLHALALRILRAAGQLSAVYSVSPRVLDEWEMRDIFDAEFGEVAGVGSSPRRRDIRVDHEAFWSTGSWLPPGLPAPEPPITEQERSALDSYYRSRSSLYCYVLPGDITRKCLEYLQAMPTDAPLPIPMQHLIVDEYQDLNRVDLQLIQEIAARGVRLFVSGDDDQSIYFFRYAMPEGIQTFDEAYPGAETHVLRHCFRCPQETLNPALALMTAYAPDERIPKEYVAVPALADPPVEGRYDLWSFRGHRREADAIAESCRALLDAGIPADRVAVLLSSRPALERFLVESFNEQGVPYELDGEDRFSDEVPGRALLGLLRCVQDPDDFVALRTLIGVQEGVGVRTCAEVAAWALRLRIRYGDILTTPPEGLSARGQRAIEAVRDALTTLSDITPETPVDTISESLVAAVESLSGSAAAQQDREYLADMPPGMTVEEACNLLSSPTPRAASAVMSQVRIRLGLDVDEVGPAVRIMTLHGSKGLTFDVVFIPGLERDLLPSRRDAPFVGLVQQAARLLYVGMTRARTRVVLSFAQYRMVNGQNERRDPTSFVGNLSGRFETRDGGFTDADVADVVRARLALEA